VVPVLTAETTRVIGPVNGGLMAGVVANLGYLIDGSAQLEAGGDLISAASPSPPPWRSGESSRSTWDPGGRWVSALCWCWPWSAGPLPSWLAWFG
jgi:hypothetical protein